LESLPSIQEEPVKSLRKTILESENPAEIIQSLSPQDYFQLIKAMDENDVLVILESGSTDQWQFLLDLELWNQDQLDIAKASRWLYLLERADSDQLIDWLFTEGEELAHYFFSKVLKVIFITEPNEAKMLPEGFFSLDGEYYLRIEDPAYREGLVDILRTLSIENYERYQNLLFELDSVIPAELEEEMYRLRNIRLAEEGFLPYEEAVAVYAPLEPSALNYKKDKSPSDRITLDSESLRPVPLLPLAQTRTRNSFLEGAGKIRDPFLLNRVRLEFAGLANQILSADRIAVIDTESIIASCDRAARLINLAVEKVCGHDPVAIEDMLRQNHLAALFRVGSGLILKLKWEAERWRKTSWFHRQGLEDYFWGERGKVLAGLLQKRPSYYAGPEAKELYRDFEKLNELQDVLEVLQGVMVLDGLLKKMAQAYALPEDFLNNPEPLFYPLLFNFWARLRLQLPPSLTGISLKEAQRFFSDLRNPSAQPPFVPDDFQTIFIKDLMAQTAGADRQAAVLLEKILGEVWKDFQEEYEKIAIEDLDPRYSGFLTILS